MPDEYTLQPIEWHNLFNVSDQYDSYKIIVKAKTQDTDYWQNGSTDAYVDVINQAAYCSQIKITTHTMSINENSTYPDYFTVINSNTGENFKIQTVSLSSNDPSTFTITQTGNLSQIYAGQQDARINFTVKTGNADSTKWSSGNVGIIGQFSDSGTWCNLNYNNGGQTFSVQVIDKPSATTGKCSQITSTPYTLYIDEGQTQSFGISVRNDSNEDLKNVVMGVTDDSSAFSASIDQANAFTRLRSGETKSIGITIGATNVSYTQSGTAYIRIEGDFLDSFEACRNDKIEIPVSVVVRNTSIANDCNNISINADSVQANENQDKTIQLGINNSDSRAFYVEELQVYDYSSVFDSSALDKPSSISGKGNSSFNARISALSVSSDTTGTAYAKLKGRFLDGQKCDYFDIPEKSFSVTVKNISEASTACRQVSLQAFPIVVGANSSAASNFYVQNNSNQTFYIDYANVYDSSKWFAAKVENYDAFALSGSNATVKAAVYASNPGQTINESGYFEVRGHFNDNTYCAASNIGTETFPVRVENNATSCNGFALTVPEELRGSGKTLLQFNYSNPANYSATITLKSQEAGIETKSFSVGANSSGSLSTYIDMPSSGSGTVEFNASTNSCTVAPKFTMLRTGGSAGFSAGIELDRYLYPIYLNAGEFSVPVTISNDSGNTQNVSIYFDNAPSDWQVQGVTLALEPYEKGRQTSLRVKATNLSFSGNVNLTARTASETYSRVIKVEPSAQGKVEVGASAGAQDANGNIPLKVTVANNSNSTATGIIKLSLPTGWNWSGNNSVSVAPGEKKEVSLTVKPAGNFTGTEQIGVSFVPSSGQPSSSSSVKVNSSVPLFPNALFGLAGNMLAFIIGVVVIAALIALALFKLTRQSGQKAKTILLVQKKVKTPVKRGKAKTSVYTVEGSFRNALKESKSKPMIGNRKIKGYKTLKNAGVKWLKFGQGRHVAIDDAIKRTKEAITKPKPD